MARKINIEDYIGKRYGMLTVIGKDEKLSKEKRNLMAICQCDCGNQKIARLGDVESGKTTSCGCLWREENIENKGLTNHPIYPVWNGQRNRCENPKNLNYHNYGGRGIKHEITLKELIKWCEDNPKPSPEHSIDRIDNDGNYSLNNIKWSDKMEQVVNSRKSINAIGVRKIFNRWHGSIMIYKKLYQKYFNTREEAVVWRKEMEAYRDRLIKERNI